MKISKFVIDDFDYKIQDYSTKMGIIIPDTYKRFLKKYNGGLTINTKFNINGIKSDVKAFYGLGDVKYSLNKVDIIESDNVKYIPIACDSFGNMIMISAGDENVYFSDHEKGFDLKPLNCDFTHFINNCITSEINPYAYKSPEEREADMISRGKESNITDGLREMWKAEYEKYSSLELEEVVI